MADRQLRWKLLGAVTGLLAGLLTRTALKTSWRKLQGTDPPTNPASPRTTWPEALAWAASSGVALAVMRLVAQRGAAEAWKAKTGSYPKELESVSP